MPDRRKSSLDKVNALRERPRSRAFEAEAHRQSAAVAQSPHALEDQDFIDALSDLADE